MDRFDRAGAQFAKLCRTMAAMRSGCQWDSEQTHHSLQSYLLEETYELLDALESGPPAARCEELGDLLFQIVFHAEIATQAGEFDAADVARGIDDKLVRRHPHLFGDGIERNWEEMKAEERPERQSRLDGIPRSLPGLLRALRVGERAAAARFDWPNASGALVRVRQELEELAPHVAELVAAAGAAPPEVTARATDEAGDLLFSLVNVCRHLAIDPERALGLAVEKFQRRFRWIETQLRQQNRRLDDTPLDQLDTLWEEAKLSDPA